ncbi:MAG: hypothetical protein AAB614_02570 [Patescibacteria group bacterium]
MIKKIDTKFKFQNSQRGFAALLTIVVVSVAVLILAYSASILGLGELDLGYTSQKGEEAFAIADGCMEESFRRLRLNVVYLGETITTSNGLCVISVVAVGSDRTITVTANTTDFYYKKIEANITLSSDILPVITINSWAEK